MNINELIENHISLANKIAYSKRKSLPSRVSFDEIQSAAFTGLTIAANRYESHMGEFETYAAYRIFGEIQDYLRTLCWGGRKQNAKVSSWDTYDCADEPEPDSFSEFFDDLTESLKTIIKQALYLYYAEDLTLRQVAGRLGISQTRVHQLLRAGIEEIRQKSIDKA